LKHASNPPKKSAEAGTEQIFDAKVLETKYAKWFPDLKPQLIAQLIEFQGALIRGNKLMNLVPATTIKNAEAVHFADAIHASRLIAKAAVVAQPIYDMGGGCGFPGLVFALLYPDRKVVVVERDSRRVEFCRQVIAGLKISNATIETKSFDDLPPIFNGVGRGTMPLAKMMLAVRKSIVKGGRFFHIKSDAWATELSGVPSQLFSYWTPSLVGQYRIPETSTDMAIVLTEKIAE
jgi:16S rRNA (guanine527-N7)-methyltransferase